ncbi:MAG TPA: hypothetical protein VMV92_03020 [Streptosporangiaceae bacterium]|nr:hypothetical protein [Streptosporangiaceae bacterium]
MTRIHGICERAGSPEQPLGPGVTVPASVPLLVNFDLRRVIGRAALARDADGSITASAEVTGEGAALLGDLRYLAIGVSHVRVSHDGGCPSGRITSGEIRSVAIVRANIDPDLPPYEVEP